ncbi:MAG: hypothetical protein HYX69_03065 [Planctomycetia bacterium]|nr:hypothetical protein [Planctomycetia bacterium]
MRLRTLDTRWRTFRASILLPAVFLISLASGCAAFKASQQPAKKNLGVLSQGTPRTHVIAELGAPVWSDNRGPDTVDVFAFKQGYCKPVKAGRALVHAAGDVMTFGLWEVVGIPAETLIDGTDVKVEVHYDHDQVVERVDVIAGEKAINPPKLFAWHPRQSTKSAAASETAIAADAKPSSAVRPAAAIVADEADSEEMAVSDSPTRR